MTGDDQGPIFARDIDVPLEDPDRLPLDEVDLRADRSSPSGEVYWHWRIAGMPESLVGYRDRDVARRHGAEELRKRRQLAAMREGER